MARSERKSGWSDKGIREQRQLRERGYQAALDGKPCIAPTTTERGRGAWEMGWRSGRIARETLQRLPEMIPGGIYTAVGTPIVTWVVNTRAEAEDIVAKLRRFETIQTESGGGERRFYVQAFPR